MEIEDILDAEAWVHGAPLGSEITYYRGSLPKARGGATKRSATINSIADIMLGHSGAVMPKEKRALQGVQKVRLYQVRHGEFDYSYMARKVAS